MGERCRVEKGDGVQVYIWGQGPGRGGVERGLRDSDIWDYEGVFPDSEDYAPTSPAEADVPASEVLDVGL